MSIITISKEICERDYERVRDDWCIKNRPSDVEKAESIIIQEGTTKIGDLAFYDCVNLKSIEIPNSVEVIGESAFYNCSNLKDINTNYQNAKSSFPNSIKKIEGWAFTFCSNLTSLTIPDSIEEIGKHAFYNCLKLTSITIPEHLDCSRLDLPTRCKVIIRNVGFEDDVDFEENIEFINEESENSEENEESKDNKENKDNEESENSQKEKFNQIINLYSLIHNYEITKPSKPKIQSINNDFLNNTIERLNKIKEIMKTLDEAIDNFDKFIVENNSRTNEISEFIDKLNSL